MRLLHTLNNVSQGKRFSTFLFSKGIANTCESVINNDWGSPEYGNIDCKIWIENEDQVLDAKHLLEEFLNDPESSQFNFDSSLEPSSPISTPLSVPPPIAANSQTESKIENLIRDPSTSNQKSGGIVESIGTLTFCLILLCTVLFTFGQFTKPKVESFPGFFPYIPILSSPIYKKLYFDYPKAFEYVDKYMLLYGNQNYQNISQIPSEGQFLIGEYLRTPYWQGIYPALVSSLRESTGQKNEKESLKTSSLNAPLFEKIRQGEFWRLFTPALLHSDIFHILFNLLWLLTLGKQMEQKMSGKMYLIFIVLTGVFSNTAQYLMSGSGFIGISGVLCAMLTFIWFRQKKAPWEGYQMHPTTIAVMAIFVLSLAGLQIASFFAEVYFNTSFSSGFANTAHLSGAFIGYIFSKIPLFTHIKI